MIIGIDFDGTCVEHKFPEVGEDIGAAPVLRLLVTCGHKLVLWTMRSDNEKSDYLTQAVNWFRENHIELWGINQNPDQRQWTISPKAYCNIYIDDAALGVPLTEYGYVDWNLVQAELNRLGYFSAACKV